MTMFLLNNKLFKQYYKEKPIFLFNPNEVFYEKNSKIPQQRWHRLVGECTAFS
jgi:hypothetical protein